jgi:serine/threonine protein kinase
MPRDETRGAPGRADRPDGWGKQRRAAPSRRTRDRQRPLQPGDRVDQWTLRERFGKGGSGEVWAAEDESDRDVALKILWNKKYTARFLDEIRLYRSLGDCPGILPLIDASLPPDGAQPSATNLWLAMEVATPLEEYLNAALDLEITVIAINDIAGTLAALADEGIYHRDIKPSNLYWLDGGFAIGDFGIADFPDKAGVTRAGEKLGPANFLAPEMIEYSGEVQSGPADVYSLAKTLWALAASRRFPPPGELRADTAPLRLSSYMTGPRAVTLESLIERSTAHDPARRPSMQEFSDELSWWLEPEVVSKPDLSEYRDEITRIREMSRVTRRETNEQRTARLRNEASKLVHETLFQGFHQLLNSAGLQRINGEGGPSKVKWPHDDDYGGSWSSAEFGIDTLASPWMELRAGVFHRERPIRDESDCKVAVLLTMRAANQDTQENLCYFFESFRPGSIALDRIVKRIKVEFGSQVAGIMGKFLTECKSNGVPRLRLLKYAAGPAAQVKNR